MIEGLKKLKMYDMEWDDGVAYCRSLRPQVEQWNHENEDGQPAMVAFNRAMLDNDIITATKIYSERAVFLLKNKRKKTHEQAQLLETCIEMLKILKKMPKSSIRRQHTENPVDA